MQVKQIDEEIKNLISDSDFVAERRKFMPNKVNELYLYRRKSKEIYVVQSGEIFISGRVYEEPVLNRY